MSPASRGFRHLHRAPAGKEDRVPPGQYVTDGFPVLSAGPTPHTPLEQWTFSITQGDQTRKSWTWQEFLALPTETVTADIHCVTRWSKLDTEWQGVSVDTLMDQVEHDAPYVMAFCDGGYTTNLPIDDITGGQAWVAYSYDGGPLDPEHGGPARLLVPPPVKREPQAAMTSPGCPVVPGPPGPCLQRVPAHAARHLPPEMTASRQFSNHRCRLRRKALGRTEPNVTPDPAKDPVTARTARRSSASPGPQDPGSRGPA